MRKTTKTTKSLFSVSLLRKQLKKECKKNNT